MNHPTELQYFRKCQGRLMSTTAGARTRWVTERIVLRDWSGINRRNGGFELDLVKRTPKQQRF